MTYKLKLLPKAKTDLKDSRNWYNKQQLELGKKFLFSVHLTFDLLLNNPLLFAVRYQTMRAAPVRDFPFLIYYFIDSEKKYIVITTVLHTSRNPDIV